MSARIARWGAWGALVALIFLCVAWEVFLAPLKPGGSWMVLKVVPLLFPVFGILRGKRYTFQWTTLLIWLYFAEGVTRAWSDRGLSARLGALEVVLSLAYFACAIGFIRQRRA